MRKGYRRIFYAEVWKGDPPEELKERFFAKVNKTEDCWLWEGRINPGGTGQFRIAPKSSGNQTGTRLDVHKLAYLWMVGPIKEGHQIDHLCRVPWCVNPDHLEQVTPEENRRRAKVWRKRDKLRAEGLARSREAKAKTRERKRAKGQ